MFRLAFFVAAAVALVAPTQADEQAPIIDVHLHAVPVDGQGPPPQAICAPFASWPWRDPRLTPEQFAAFMFKEGRWCERPLWSPLTDAENLERALEILRRRNVRGAVSGHAATLDRWLQAEPRRLWRAECGPVPELRQAIDSGKVQIVAECAPQYEGTSPDDPSLEPLFALAEEKDVPLGIHLGPGPPGAPYLPGAGRYEMKLSNPLALEKVLVRHPKLRLWVMHAGWPLADEMLGLLYAHPQAYVDVGVIVFGWPRAEFYGYLRRIVEAGFVDRVLFGSDQMIWPEAVERSIESIEGAPFLTAGQKRAILHDNAVRFLRLDDKDDLPRR
jgi:uncharacterized protein